MRHALIFVAAFASGWYAFAPASTSEMALPDPSPVSVESPPVLPGEFVAQVAERSAGEPLAERVEQLEKTVSMMRMELDRLQVKVDPPPAAPVPVSDTTTKTPVSDRSGVTWTRRFDGPPYTVYDEAGQAVCSDLSSVDVVTKAFRIAREKGIAARIVIDNTDPPNTVQASPPVPFQGPMVISPPAPMQVFPAHVSTSSMASPIGFSNGPAPAFAIPLSVPAVTPRSRSVTWSRSVSRGPVGTLAPSPPVCSGPRCNLPR